MSGDVFSLARRVAKYNVPVLICGEIGTGKKFVAKFIHQHAQISAAPYVRVNCAAIAENMLDEVLFGYEKENVARGNNSVPGKIEQANGGTLLLDEIGDMSVALQAKLVRFMQEQAVERPGSREAIPVNVRLLATTRKDLHAEMTAGRFLQELYYRIAVMPICLQPLRASQQEIVALAHSFLLQYQAFQPAAVNLSKQAQQVLLHYNWPGNIRELENVIQRGLILCNGSEITPAELGLPVPQAAVTVSGEATLPAAQQQSVATDIQDVKRHGRFAEYQYILELLKQHKGSKSRTAEALGITSRALRYRLASMREDGVDIVGFLRSL